MPSKSDAQPVEAMLNEACRRLLALVVSLLPSEFTTPQEINEASISFAARACHAYRDLVARAAGPSDPAEVRERVDAAGRKTDAIRKASASTFDAPATLSIEEFQQQLSARAGSHPPSETK